MLDDLERVLHHFDFLKPQSPALYENEQKEAKTSHEALNYNLDNDDKQYLGVLSEISRGVFP